MVIFYSFDNPNNWLTTILLVGGIPTHLKNMTSSVGMMKFPMKKINPCSKPPTSFGEIRGLNCWLYPLGNEQFAI